MISGDNERSTAATLRLIWSGVRAPAMMEVTPGRCNSQAIATIRAARDELMEQDHTVIMLFCGDVVVGRIREAIRELTKLMIVRREDRAAPRRVMKMLGDRPCDRQPVVGAGSAPDFVQDDE